MPQIEQKRVNLTDWYNSKKRFTTILINIFLIFLVTSFIPSLVVQFPTLLKNLMTSEQISQQPILNLGYFVLFAFIYLVSVLFTHLMELGDGGKSDNKTFAIFTIFMMFVVGAMWGLGVLVVSSFPPIFKQ